MKRIFAILFTIIMAMNFTGCGDNKMKKDENTIFDEGVLSVMPVITKTDIKRGDNIQAIYYEGAEYNGKDTKIFAYIGAPATEKPENGYPAMILVHGGLGRAESEWVQLWTDRGYVAIAMSIDANMSTTADASDVMDNPDGGPKISVNAEDLKNPTNSWEYISVCNIIYAHNILRSLDIVDKSNVGITGISWGSYLMNIVVGVDNRIKFGVPIYGAGFNHEDYSSSMAGVFAFNEEDMEIYANKFDPSVYVKKTKASMFWIAGATDFAFSLICNQKTADLSQGKTYLSWRDNIVHGQQPGDRVLEIFAFADKMTKGVDDMLEVTSTTVSNGVFSATYTKKQVKEAHLYYTQEMAEYIHQAEWFNCDVEVSDSAVSCAVPEGATYAFIEITDENDYVVSSKIVAL